MNPVAVIEKKKRGEELTPEEIEEFLGGYLSGSVPDYQVSAFLMATLFRGMTRGETAALTRWMTASGSSLDLSAFPSAKVDKHSTGGVGDKVSLALAPLVASCGVLVPMLSGRALGHTGGTLDKLEAIPGYRTQLAEGEMLSLLEGVGMFIAGQTETIAPADMRLYALRDVTGTVDSIPLITASILSKKAAEGIEALVMDVKWGEGAFMPTREQARRLGEAIGWAGEDLGLKVSVILSAMNEPLGKAVGNALEVAEAFDLLAGKGPEDLCGLTVALAVEMLLVAGLETDPGSALFCIRESLRTGRAGRLCQTWVEAQGGRLDWADSWLGLELAPVRGDLVSPRSGYIARVRARTVAEVVIELGGGRMRMNEDIDRGVGVVLHKKGGEEVRRGEPLAAVYARREGDWDRVREKLKSAFVIGDEPPAQTPFKWEKLG